MSDNVMTTRATTREEAIAEERKRWDALHQVVDLLVEVGGYFWEQCDGQGGGIYRLIQNAFEDAGYEHHRRPETPFILKEDAIKALARRDGWECHYCGAPLGLGHPCVQMPTKDHKIPKSRGGGNELDNLVLSCLRCNCSKGTKTHDEFCRVCEP